MSTVLFNKRTIMYLVLVPMSILFILLAYRQGMSEDAKGDFYIYYQAGKNFFLQKPIYTQGLSDGGFTYPPFTAMLFQLLALLPFQASAVAFSYIVNYGMWISSLFIIYKILSEIWPADIVFRAIVLAFFCSARFYWHNFIWAQANMLVLNATLLGIFFYVTGRYRLCYLFLILGCFLKITPLLFVGCIALKRGFKDWLTILLISSSFFILPILFRGLEQGINDWANYYTAFLQTFFKGQVDGHLISLGIPSLIKKLSSGNELISIKPVIPLSESAFAWLLKIIQVIFFIVFVIQLFLRKRMHQALKLGIGELCLIFLLPLLLLGRVWEHHHAVTSFVYAYLFVYISLQHNRKSLYILLAISLFVGLIGQDTVGDYVYSLSQFFCLITILMTGLFFFIVFRKDRIHTTNQDRNASQQ